MVIFADHACNDRFSADGPPIVEVGHVPSGLRCDVRRSLLPELVRSVPVVMDQILLEREDQVAFFEDQDPVQEFGAGCR